MEANSDAAFVVPTFHPAFLLRGAQQYAEVVSDDIKRAMRIAANGGWEDKTTCYTVLPKNSGNMTVDQAVNYLDQNWRARKPVAIDTEAYGVGKRDALDAYSARMHAIGFSFAPSMEAVSFMTDGTLGQAETQRLMNISRLICADPNVPKMFFNMAYDVEIMYRHTLPVIGTVYDNMVNHHISDAELEHNLGFVSQQFLDIDPWKVAYRSVERRGHGTLQALAYYNAKDTLATQLLTPILWQRVADIGQIHIAQFETRLMELAARMGRVGMPVDEEKRVEISAQLQIQRDKAVQYIREQMHWPDFDPKKPGNRRELLYDRLKLPVSFYTEKRGDPSTAAKALIEHLGIPVVRALIKFDERQKLLSTFVAKLPDLVDGNGRIHVRWKSTGTVGSRWASESPNYQNWPKWLRAISRTREGRILVGADSSAVEYRIIAGLSGCTPLIEAFNANKDVHSMVAGDVFEGGFTNLAPDDIMRKKLRTIVKRVVYARNYRAAPKTIYENLRNDPKLPASIRAALSLALITKVAKNFDKVYWQIPRWCEEEWERTNRLGYQDVVPLGRRRFHSVRPVEITVTSNNPIQFAAGDYQNISMLAVDDYLKERFPTAHIVANVHDQIVVECDTGDAEHLAQVLAAKMTHVMEGPAGPIRLVAEPDISRSWDQV